ncbi:MAG: DUF3152 domain-containing protein [Nocardioidaceae bacterium]
MGLTKKTRDSHRAGGAVLGVVLALLAPLLTAAPAGAGTTTIVSLTPPVVTGDAVFGQRLRTSDGTWTPDGLTFTYQWLRDGSPIGGATKRSYRLGLDDLGASVTAEVTASDGSGGSLAADSTPVGPVVKADFADVPTPTVSGVRRFGRTLTAKVGAWTPRATTVRLRWLRDGEPIDGARRASYSLAPEDVGHRVRLQVTGSRAGYVTTRVLSSQGPVVAHRVPLRRTVSYHVETRGRITANLAQFKEQVQETYDDPRGWRGAGIGFKRVKKGGAFTLVLAQASWVPRFSSECSAQWSCRVGRFVIINQTRWLHASPAWNAAHRSRRDYRHMVANHETGHWLGHGHASCPGRGRLAPVMMQQSKGTDGCRLNPWPLVSELWAHPSGKSWSTGARASEQGRASDRRVWVG